MSIVMTASLKWPVAASSGSFAKYSPDPRSFDRSVRAIFLVLLGIQEASPPLILPPKIT